MADVEDQAQLPHFLNPQRTASGIFLFKNILERIQPIQIGRPQQKYYKWEGRIYLKSNYIFALLY